MPWPEPMHAEQVSVAVVLVLEPVLHTVHEPQSPSIGQAAVSHVVDKSTESPSHGAPMCAQFIFA